MHSRSFRSLSAFALPGFALASLLIAHPALAVDPPPSSTPIPPLQGGGQFSVRLTDAICHFEAIPETGFCAGTDGSLRPAGGAWELNLENLQNLKNLKYLRLEVELYDNVLIGGVRTDVVFSPLDAWKAFVPIVTPDYLPAPPNPPTVTLSDTAFLPAAAGTGAIWQMQWTIFPQPASEVVTLRDWNMFVTVDANRNHIADPGEIGSAQIFDPSWLKAISLSSHCPEPASWAMLIFGFGMVGTRLRREGPGRRSTRHR